MHKLRQEIEAADKNGSFSDLVKYNEAAGLPYLSAVIKESMRMFPSVGLTLPRIVPKGGAVIADKYIPAGVSISHDHCVFVVVRIAHDQQFIVGINAHALHFDRSIFGHDADDFNPERWLRPDVSRMDRCFFEVCPVPNTALPAARGLVADA